MRLTTRLILPITLILLSLTIGCDRDEADHTEILTIGPYRETCQGFIEQQCYLEYNEEAEAWHFFFEAIQGFEYEEGYIYTLKVRLHERPEGIQDVGRYAYRLVEVISKEEASVDERPPRKPTE